MLEHCCQDLTVFRHKSFSDARWLFTCSINIVILEHCAEHPIPSTPDTCVCVYITIHTLIYIHVRVYTCVYTHSHLYDVKEKVIHKTRNMCLCVCVCVHIRVCTPTQTQTAVYMVVERRRCRLCWWCRRR